MTGGFTMRALRSLLILVVIALVAIGFYRGWFSVTSKPGNQESDVTLSIDKEKIREDTNKVKAEARGLKHDLEERAKGK
jgi:hypothetical protein